MPNTDPLAEPGRVAFAGDWHQNTDYAQRSIRHAARRGADVILHLGDFGYNFTGPFLAGVTAALDEAGIHLLFVDGNHENFTRLYRYPILENGLRKLTDRVWHLPRGFRWEWSAVHFLALGGAHSVDRPYRVPGVSWWPEETIGSGDVAKAVEGGFADVLVSHDCPAGVVIPGIDDRTSPPPFPPLEILRSDEHRQRLRGVVDVVQPSAVWHGHYHMQHETVADFGYGPVAVNGLDCDEAPIGRNIAVVDTVDLLVDSAGMRRPFTR
jgi:hypothetical protein